MKRFTTSLIFSLLLAGTAHAEYPWPEQVVRIEDMQPRTPMRISVPGGRSTGEVRGPVVIRVHVDQEGMVRKVLLITGCGSPAHDEAALHAMRALRFRPYLVDGNPTDVTLVVPLHLPIPRT